MDEWQQLWQRASLESYISIGNITINHKLNQYYYFILDQQANLTEFHATLSY